MSARFATLILLVLAAPHATAQQGDHVAEKLERAQGAYLATLDKSRDALLSEIDKAIEAAESNTRIDVKQQLAVVDSLKAERRAFQNDYRALPKTKGLRLPVSRFTRTVTAAKSKCEKAFDIAAREYQRAKQLDEARAVLSTKESFFKPELEPPFEGADKRFIDFAKTSLHENPDLFFWIVRNRYKDDVFRGTRRAYSAPPVGRHPEAPNSPFKEKGLHRFDGKVSEQCRQYATYLIARHNKKRITKP